MKIILSLLLASLLVTIAQAQVDTVWASTTGSTLGELDLTTGQVSDQYKLLVFQNGQIVELGASVFLDAHASFLWAYTSGGQWYGVNTDTLYLDRNGTEGYLLTPINESMTVYGSGVTIQVSPSPAEIYDDGKPIASLPNASGASSGLETGGNVYAEDGNNNLYIVKNGQSVLVGKATGTQGNIQSITATSETPEPSTTGMVVIGGIVMTAAIRHLHPKTQHP